MKARYILISLLASLKVMANPLMGSDGFTYGALHSKVAPQAAPDPPPAPTPLPLSTDGVLPDGTVINYTPTPNSCWTQPLSRPAVNAKYDHGKCSVCVLQRRGTDLSSDYQLWARDNKNNAMGNMPATTVWPYDAKNSVTDQIQSAVLMGSSNIELNSSLSSMNPAYSQVNLMWGTQQAQYDPAPGGNGGELCSPAGTATNGAVVYFTCSFAC